MLAPARGLSRRPRQERPGSRRRVWCVRGRRSSTVSEVQEQLQSHELCETATRRQSTRLTESDAYFARKKGEHIAGMVDFDWIIQAGPFGNQTVFAIT